MEAGEWGDREDRQYEEEARRLWDRVQKGKGVERLREMRAQEGRKEEQKEKKREEEKGEMIRTTERGVSGLEA